LGEQFAGTAEGAVASNDFFKKKAIQSNSSAYHDAYKDLRNKINKQIIMQHYYTGCIDRNKNSTKLMWKVLII
jgi:hypothetical protein